MKKYSYYYIDLDETILANSGDECQELYDETHDEEYTGNILLTNLETGESNMMYHISTPEREKKYNTIITPEKLCLLNDNDEDVVTFHVLSTPQICQIRREYLFTDYVRDFLKDFIPDNCVRVIV